MDDKELWGEKITEKEREKLKELLKESNETTEKKINGLQTRCHFRIDSFDKMDDFIYSVAIMVKKAKR